MSVTLRALGFSIWFSFILFCIGLNQSHGLSCADDGWHAIIAKSLASGLGYATTFPVVTDLGRPILFNPLSGTGPTLIVPCALAFKLFGKNEVLPGLVAIVMWGGLLTFLLVRINRRTDAPSFLLGVAVMCASFVAIFSFHFEQWYAFLGEIVATALIIVAHWILANERFSAKWLLLTGLAVGFAFQAKFLAAIAVTGIALLFVIRGIHAGCRPAQWLRYGTMLLIGCVIPTLFFEGYKLSSLGLHAYAMNWQELLAATMKMGIANDIHVTWPFLQERMALVYERFGLNLLGLLALNVLGITLSWRSELKNWALFSTGILLSATSLAIYWVTLSIGWSRYLVICIAMGAFLLSVPIFTLEWWRKLSFTFLIVFLLRAGFSRAGYPLQSIDHGLFKPTTERSARGSLVRVIEKLKKERPTILASHWWGSFTDVEFLFSGSMNFRKIETIVELPGPKLVLFNHRFDPPRDEKLTKLKARASEVVFKGGPYELIEVW